MRKRLGLKEIEAPSIYIAENCLIDLLKNLFHRSLSEEQKVYYHKNDIEQKLKVSFDIFSFTMELQRR